MNKILKLFAAWMLLLSIFACSLIETPPPQAEWAAALGGRNLASGRGPGLLPTILRLSKMACFISLSVWQMAQNRLFMFGKWSRKTGNCPNTVYNTLHVIFATNRTTSPPQYPP